jgi:hypothetical protein
VEPASRPSNTSPAFPLPISAQTAREKHRHPEHIVGKSAGSTQKRIVIAFAVVEALFLGAFVLSELLG